jgi:hypothetical protein
MGRGTHANYVALSDRDLPRLQTANDAIAASGRFRRYGPVRLDVCLQKMWGDHHPHNQNREVKKESKARREAARGHGNTFRSDLELPFAMDSVQALPHGDLRNVG